MKKISFPTVLIILLAALGTPNPVPAKVIPISCFALAGSMPQIAETSTVMGTASFCDPVEISIAVASNAFEKDRPLTPGETCKIKKPVRWQMVKQYSGLPFDAVPFSVVNVGTRFEGYFDLTGDYHFGNPGEEELAKLFLDYNYYVEVVFSVYDAKGNLIEDTAGIYQIDAITQELVTDPTVHLQRLVHLFRNESSLSIHESYCALLAENAMNAIEGRKNFSILFTMCEFIEKRCDSLARTPLYSACDLYAYMGLLNALDEGLKLYMFEIKSSSVDPLIVKQCRAAIRKVQGLRDLVADIINR